MEASIQNWHINKTTRPRFESGGLYRLGTGGYDGARFAWIAMTDKSYDVHGRES